MALTVTPALSLHAAARARPTGSASRRSSRGCKRALPRRAAAASSTGPALARSCLGVAFAGSALAGRAALGEEFLPDFQETDFLMHWVEKPGTSLEAMRRITIAGQPASCGPSPACATSARTSAGPRWPTKWSGPNFTELWISIDPKVDYEATVAKIQEVVDGYPGLYRDVLTYLRERIKEVLTGASATIVVRIYGPELDVPARARRRRSSQGDARASTGVVDLKVEPQVLVPQVEVRFRPEAAARFGLTAGHVRAAADDAGQGHARSARSTRSRRSSTSWSGAAPTCAADVPALRALPIDTPPGGAGAAGRRGRRA